MNIWKFIKPDKRVMSVFSILFLLSVIGSFFVLGHPGHVYYGVECDEYFGYVRGVGLPFGWADMHFATMEHCNGTQCFTGTCYYPPVFFDPINFILDIIIFYVVALLVVRIYGKPKRKPERKKRK